MNQNDMKQAAARAAIEWIEDKTIVGVGSGSTVGYFIEALAEIKHRIAGAVASSKATAERLKALGIPVFDLNSVDEVTVYVDGADEIDPHLQMIKGGGAALTGEKIVAAVAKRFICIADQTKYVDHLGQFPIPIEVIPMARSFVGRELVKLGGQPVYRQGTVTDYGNIIIDVYHLDMTKPITLEASLNNISGVVTNGIFAKRPADVLLLGRETGVETITTN